MPTLNGVSFTIESVGIPQTINQVPKEFPSTADQQIKSYGIPGIQISISAAVYTLSDADAFLDELIKQGSQTLVLASGYQYEVYILEYTIPEPFAVEENYYLFEITIVTETPFQEDTTLITRSKTISTNPQTWSQDDSANDIDTDGDADTIPDIEVTAGTSSVSATSQATSDDCYSICNHGAVIDFNQTTYNTNVPLNSSNSPGQTITVRRFGAGILWFFVVYVDTISVGAYVTLSCYDSPGGTLLDSDSVLITSTGEKWFDMSPLLVAESTDADCSDTEGNQVYIVLSTGGDMTLRSNSTSVYAYGSRYNNGTIQSGDLYFKVDDAYPIEKVTQTFQVSSAATATSIILKMCKYQYAGSNSVDLVLKQGATTIGTSSVVLSSSTLVDTTFNLTPVGPGLGLSPSTTYTIEITPPSDSTSSSPVLLAYRKSDVYASGSVTLTDHLSGTYTPSHDIYFKVTAGAGNSEVDVYNNADSTVKCRVADEMLSTSAHRVNEDGTGTVVFSDNFTTDKYLKTTTSSGVTYDDPNDELDIADDGYIYWKLNTSPYAIRNHPDFTATIDITAGTPTIQISEDGSTWYDIDTAIVDNVSTTYDLVATGDLVLKKKSLFYVRVDCTATGVHTCSVKSISMSIGLQTIDAELPVINKGGAANTMRCDQGSDSGVDCTVALYYHDLYWGG